MVDGFLQADSNFLESATLEQLKTVRLKKTLQEQPAVVRAHAGAEIAQGHQPHAHDEGQMVQIAQIAGVAQAVVGMVPNFIYIKKNILLFIPN